MSTTGFVVGRINNRIKVEPFDTVRHLDNPEVVALYLAEALETGDRKLILRAIGNVVRASRIADSGRSRCGRRGEQ